MNRDQWSFDYTAANLADAARLKAAYHTERRDWWKDRKDELIEQIKREGLEIDEKLALQYQTPKSRDWERGARVMVRNDLQQYLDECFDKLRDHTRLINEYDGWQQMLNANPEARVSLDQEDWLYFFGRETAHDKRA